MRGRELAKKYNKILSLLSSYYSLFSNKSLAKKIEKDRNKSGKLAYAKRYCMLKALCKTIGENVLIKESCFLLNAQNISLGNNVSIQPQCYFEGYGGIEIGNDVSIAHGVSIISVTHNFSDTTLPIKEQGVTPQPIKIGNNVWIGAKATILGDVTIGDNCIIGAGAVVTHNVENNNIVGGVPAKTIRKMRE